MAIGRSLPCSDRRHLRHEDALHGRDVTILQYQRPVSFSTIDAGHLSADLIERSLPLDLHRIAPEDWKIERAAIGDDPDVKPGLFDQLEKDRPACGTPCHRYGSGSNPLCVSCQPPSDARCQEYR
jgi:hypothetical protein